MYFGYAKNILQRHGLLDSNDAVASQVGIDIVYRGLGMAARLTDWAHYRTKGAFQSKPPASGTTTPVNGSASLTLSVAPADNPVGQVLYTDDGEGYVVSAWDGSTAITLTHPYQGSGISNADYTIYYQYCPFPSGVSHITRVFQKDLSEISQSENDRMEDDWVVSQEAGDAFDFAITNFPSGNGSTKAIRLWPAPNQSGLLYFNGIRWPVRPVNDTDVLDFDPDKDELLEVIFDYLAASRVSKGQMDLQAMAFFRAEIDKAVEQYQALDYGSQVWDDVETDRMF